MGSGWRKSRSRFDNVRLAEDERVSVESMLRTLFFPPQRRTNKRNVIFLQTFAKRTSRAPFITGQYLHLCSPAAQHLSQLRSHHPHPPHSRIAPDTRKTAFNPQDAFTPRGIPRAQRRDEHTTDSFQHSLVLRQVRKTTCDALACIIIKDRQKSLYLYWKQLGLERPVGLGFERAGEADEREGIEAFVRRTEGCQARVPAAEMRGEGGDVVGLVCWGGAEEGCKEVDVGAGKVGVGAWGEVLVVMVVVRVEGFVVLHCRELKAGFVRCGVLFSRLVDGRQAIEVRQWV